jgi:hypothetical protein
MWSIFAFPFFLQNKAELQDAFNVYLLAEVDNSWFREHQLAFSEKTSR